MGILRSIKNEHIIYEETNEGILIAVHENDAKTIKNYFKKYKGKKEKPNDTVSGYKFIYDEEFQSHKIDFTKVFTFQIKNLSKANEI